MDEPIAPAIPIDGVADQSPPPWAAVQSDPGFEALSPERKVVAFTRWHDDAYNHANTLPDWKEHANTFNAKAAEVQASLLKNAGVAHPDEARVRVAQKALDDAELADKAFPNVAVQEGRTVKDVKRDVLRGLGPDVFKAYLNANPLPGLPEKESVDKQLENLTPVKPGEQSISATPTAMSALGKGNFKEAGDIMANAFLDSGFGTMMFGASERNKVAEAVPWGKNPDGSTKFEYRPLGGIDTTPGVVPAMMKLAFLTPESIAGEAGVDTNKLLYMQHSPDDSDAKSIGKGVFNAAQGLLQTFLSPGMALGFGKGVASKAISLGFGADMLHAVEPQLTAADNAKNPQEFVTNLLGAAGTLAMAGAATQHGLHPAEASFGRKEIEQHAQNMTDEALAQATTPENLFALERVSPNNYSALISERSRRGLPVHEPWEVINQNVGNMSDAVLQMAGAPENLEALRQVAPATHKVVQQAIADRGIIPLTDEQMRTGTGRPDAATEAAAANLESAGGPQTAAAFREVAVGEAKTKLAEQAAAAPTSPATAPIRLTTDQDANGNYTHNLDVPATVTAEQLKSFADTLDTAHLPPEAVATLQEQLAQEIAARTAKPVTEQPKTPETATTEPVTPESVVAPEGMQAAGSQSTGEHVLSSAVKQGDKYLVGGAANTGHAGIGAFHDLPGEVPEAARGFLVQRADGKVEFVARDEAGRIADATRQRTVSKGEPLQAQELTNAPLPTGADGDLVRAAKRNIPEPETRAVVAPEGDLLAPAPPARPLAEPATPPGEGRVRMDNPRTPEEKAAQITEGQARARALVEEGGIVPAYNELHKMTGDPTTAKALRKELEAKVAEQFPPEPLGPGEKEAPGSKGKAKTLDKYLTGDVLPTVINEAGQIRPRFSGDPGITALQIDSGTVGTTPGARLYVPTEMLADHLNPAIRVAKEKDTGRAYVIGADVQMPDGSIRHITEPGQFTEDYQAIRRLQGDAQKMIGLAPEELQGVRTAVEKGVAEKKLEFGPFEFDAEAPDLVDPGEAPAASDTIKVASRGNFPVEEADIADVNKDEHVVNRIVQNHAHLDKLGIDPESIKKPGAFKDALTNISRNKEIAWTQRILAKFLMKTGIDFSNLKLDVTSKPLDYTAATWEGSKGNLQDAKIWLNAAGHFSNLSEVAGALLHEAVHHVTLFKLDNSYQRTVFEEASYRMLRKSYDKAVEASFERLYGVKGTPEQLSAFIKAQDTGETVNGIEPHRDLYGLGNIYEFAAETMSNSRFQKILSNFEGLGVALGGRKFNNLLRLVQQGLKNLFAGQPITRGSLLDDAVSHAFNFAGSGPDAERITSNKPVSRGLITRGDLVDLAKEQGMGELVDTMSEQELRGALGVEGTRPVEPEVKRTTVSGDGWLTPSGEFEPARFDDAHWQTLAENSGGFAGAGRSKLDPATQAEFDKVTRDKNGRIDSSLATKFFRDRGFVRVVDRGDMLLVEGNLTDAHRKQLIDAAVEKGVPLVQDLGGDRQHILFEPAAGTEPTPRLTRTAASLEDLRKPEASKGRDLAIDEAGNLSYSTIAESRKGPEDKNAPDLLKAATPRITHATNAEGKVEHKLEIPPLTPAEDLVKLADNISNAKIPEADKERMTAELAAAMQDRLTKKEVSGVSNARVDAARVKRGLPPRMEPLRRAMGEAWTEAMDQIANDPTSGNRIINDVNKVVRGRGTLSPVETAVLAHEQVVRENAFDNAVEQMNTAKTPEEKAAADARMSAAREAVDEVYRAADRTGTWAGQSLAARKILLNSDLTLARMEAMKKAANAGVLSEEHIKEVHTAFEAIKAAKTKADIVDELAAMQVEVDLLKELLATKDPAKAAKIREQLEQKARTPLTNDQLLERYKKALATRTKALEAKLAAGDFTKNVRAKTHLDQEALDAQVAYKRLRQKFEEGLLKDEAKRRPWTQKGLDILVDYVRAGVISSPIAYGKLLAAAAARMVLTPTEQVLGAALSKVPGINQIAKLAPREGSFSGKAEGLAIARAFTHGIGKDVGQVFRTGKTDLDVLYGRPDIKPRGKLLDWVGRTHQVIKAPVLRAEFERSYSMLYDHLKANGTDVSDPMVRMDIGLEAYRNAEKAIFKNNNRATDAYKAALAGIERKNARTGKSPLLAKAITSLIKTELPVVGVPTNIAAETMQYVFGSVTGLTKVAAALAKGVEKLHPEEADQIMRHLKKGSLGLAAAALAFYLDPDDFEAGGFYVQGEKRGKDELEPESLRIAGQHIDHHYLHNPYVLAMQVFASARRAADEGLHGDKAKGPGSAALSALFGLGETVPFTKLFTDVGAAMDDNKRSRMMAEMLKSDTIPQLVQFFAKLGDKDEEGNTIQRKADFSDGQLEGTLQTLSTGIPPVVEDLTGGRIKGRKSVDEKP